MQHACKNDPPVSTKIAKMEPTSPLLSSGLHTNSNRVPESNVSRLLDRLLDLRDACLLDLDTVLGSLLDINLQPGLGNMGRLISRKSTLFLVPGVLSRLAKIPGMRRGGMALIVYLYF